MALRRCCSLDDFFISLSLTILIISSTVFLMSVVMLAVAVLASIRHAIQMIKILFIMV